MENRELEMLRQRVAFLEQVVEQCLERIAALEARVAPLEGRPVALAPTEEMIASVARRVSEMTARPPRMEVLLGGKEPVYLPEGEGWEQEPRRRK